MNDILNFPDRAAFRAWLNENNASSEGVWLLFGKKGGPRTITAPEALEEALCFGWIDGQMQSLDETAYKKYFSARRANSKWSEKNKTLVEKLEQQGKMADFGRKKIEEAKSNGQWNAPKPLPVTSEQIEFLSDLLKLDDVAYINFEAMPPSVKRTYTKAYFDAKTDAGRESRLEWMLIRLRKNLEPM